MKNLKLLLPAALLALSACSQNTRTTDKDAATTDSTTTVTDLKSEEKGLFATMQMADTIKTGQPVQLKFTVYNHADTAQQFCKWHTPFERLMSKYLDIVDENGAEVSYKGAMAKRMMPPPADSYIKINPKDSLVSDVNVLEGYDLKNSAKYTVKYVGQNMSGLIVKDSISFVYIK
ncbi:protease [Pedobacter metabolipauper]|uniref:Protease n=1 Tax=Pedobacter metabolipauper TaxID=425513 RepID=A0A4R6SPV0_9SPHI|nr:protease [Pedobacter metabolipauper]TDQ06179.1 hypothetical protein ATK78_4560 [Pedobacter metabolipauper]